MYELVTTFHFSFANIGFAFARGFLYVMYAAFAFGAFLAGAIILVLIFILLYFTHRYTKKLYEFKENQLIKEHEGLIQSKKQELEKLSEEINALIGKKEDIDRILDFAQNLFHKFSNYCSRLIASNEKLKYALRQKYIKQATDALKTGKLDNKSAGKLNKRLKDMTDTINRIIEQEEEEFSNLSELEKQLIEKIREIGG